MIEGSVVIHGYVVDPVAGIVYGPRGKPIRRRASGYVQPKTRERTYQAHRLVWEACHGAIPPGMEINHKNGVKTDNRIENLELATSRENNVHARRTGLNRATWPAMSKAGSRNGRARLDEEKVMEIRLRRAAGETGRVLAAEFGVSLSAIYQAANGRRWSTSEGASA